MGRNSAGIRSSKKSTSDHSKGATEKGYTAKMVKNIVGMEQKYRRNKDETLHVFNNRGDIVISFAGKGAEVRFDDKKVPPNSILTHNHPRSLGTKGTASIGHSFSIHDIASAIWVNAKEMRAVTPTYTFSVKRPKEGWGVSVYDAKKAYKSAEKTVKRMQNRYLNKIGRNATNHARVDVAHHHKVMKMLADKYGWIYSKKKG